MLPEKAFSTNRSPVITNPVTVFIRCDCGFGLDLVCPADMAEELAGLHKFCDHPDASHEITPGYTAGACFYFDDTQRSWKHLGDISHLVEVQPGTFEEFFWYCYDKE